MRWTLTPLLALALAAPGFAQPGPRHDGPPGAGFDSGRFAQGLEQRTDRLAYALDLSADQRTAFDTLRKERIADARSLADKLRATGDELRVLLDAQQPDAAAVGQKVITLHQMRDQMKGERQRFGAELEKILTPEQVAAYRALERLRSEAPGGRMMMRNGGMMQRGAGRGFWQERRGFEPPPPLDDGD